MCLNKLRDKKNVYMFQRDYYSNLNIFIWFNGLLKASRNLFSSIHETRFNPALMSLTIFLNPRKNIFFNKL